MKTCVKCGKQYKTYVTINGKPRNLCKRTHCLECSPFGSHNTKKQYTGLATEKRCPKCQIVKNVNEFYMKRKSTNCLACYCKSCASTQVTIRLQKFKQKCLLYKGGKCTICGYNKCVAALHFHHRNPEVKNFNICSYQFHKWNSIIEAELDKCDLLCANCHIEQHYYR